MKLYSWYNKDSRYFQNIHEKNTPLRADECPVISSLGMNKNTKNHFKDTQDIRLPKKLSYLY